MKEYFLNLFSYEEWANGKVADVLINIDEPDEKILTLMSHIANAQIIWLARIKSAETIVQVWQVNSKFDLKKMLDESMTSLQEFVNSLNEKGFEKIITYNNTKGEKFESALSDILTHLIIHSSYHRGQIVQLLKPYFSTLPTTDYIIYKRSK